MRRRAGGGGGGGAPATAVGQPGAALGPRHWPGNAVGRGEGGGGRGYTHPLRYALSVQEKPKTLFLDVTRTVSALSRPASGRCTICLVSAEQRDAGLWACAFVITERTALRAVGVKAPGASLSCKWGMAGLRQSQRLQHVSDSIRGCSVTTSPMPQKGP